MLFRHQRHSVNWHQQQSSLPQKFTSRFLKSHRKPVRWHVCDQPMHLHLPLIIAQPGPSDTLSHFSDRAFEGTSEIDQLMERSSGMYGGVHKCFRISFATSARLTRFMTFRSHGPIIITIQWDNPITLKKVGCIELLKRWLIYPRLCLTDVHEDRRPV